MVDFLMQEWWKRCGIIISSAGYNKVHELVYFGVPSIFIPNTGTGKDDQKAIARGESIHTQYNPAIEEKVRGLGSMNVLLYGKVQYLAEILIQCLEEKSDIIKLLAGSSIGTLMILDKI